MDIHALYAVFQRRFRPARMRQFVELFGVKDGDRIIDLGGSVANWEYISQKPLITIVNLDEQKGERENIRIEQGDARALGHRDNAFEIAYSNSVIEHVGRWEDQSRFAQEIRRLAPRYYVQTPYKWFPIETHFIAPFIHFFPKSVWRRLTWLGLWYWNERPSRDEIDAMVDEVELLDVKQMRTLFPDALILRERFLGFTKSLIAVRR